MPCDRQRNQPTELFAAVESMSTDDGPSGRTDDEEWRSLEDMSERRKIQNRLAQRKFRECGFPSLSVRETKSHLMIR